MRKTSYLKILFAMVALTCIAAGFLHAEKRQKRISAGNNFQVGMTAGSYGPFNTRDNVMMFPAGSGNLTSQSWNFGLMMAVTRDFDGDGVPEDTTMSTDGRYVTGFRAEPEQADELAAIYASGQNVGTVSGDINHIRVWTTMDDDDLADWPVGGREGRNPSGEILAYGAETMYTQQGDIFLGWGYGVVPGFLKEVAFYFLNYGESNDMVYVHENIINVTEFLKYSPSASYQEFGAAHPSGWDWSSVCHYYQSRYFRWGNSKSPWSNRWAYHYEKDIDVTFNEFPQQQNWNPPEYALLVKAPLKFPEYNGETMELKNFNAAGGSFGVSGSLQLGLSGKTPGQVYRNIMGTEDFLPGVTNPFTGTHQNVWPGKLNPGDALYNQWVWGGGSAWITDACYGELHDVKPRDSYSMDYVVMFVYPGIIPFVPPPLDIANIESPIIQEALAPVVNSVNVARTVFEGGYILPETPAAPALTIIPGDRQVSITWSDVNLNTPDSYYYFLNDNNLDPGGYYQEYDFEGYRLYRSFVGPNDTHSELMEDFNRSSGNIQFHYVDKLDDDFPQYRMRNGMKIWYALVPYDKNYDVSNGAQFSLPLPESAKIWNRPGEKIYTVVPRSNSSDYVESSLDGEPIFHPFAGSDPLFLKENLLQGNGDGTLAEPPAYLMPVATFDFEAVNPERITSEKTLYVEVASNFRAYGNNNNSTPVTFKMSEGSTMVQESPTATVRSRNGAFNYKTVFSGPVDAKGAAYALSASFDYMSNGDFRSKVRRSLDAGGYTGGNLVLASSGGDNNRAGGYPPSIPGQYRDGRFTVTWGSGTVTVTDLTRGYTLPFVEYPDQAYGWGFVTQEAFGSAFSGRGTLYDEMQSDTPVGDRTAKMVDTLPTDNTEEFGIWLNGVLMVVRGTDGVIGGMPSAGTVFTADFMFGSWNGDQTIFYQEAGPPFPGDRWEFKIVPTTMNADDADLSKVRVVPNPYVATSYLDLSPNNRRIEFTNLPSRCTIRIYSLGGNLVNVLNHIGSSRQGWGDYTDWDRLTDNEPRVFEGYDNHGGAEPWNLRNRFGQTVSSGLYFYHVTDQRGESHTGKFYVIN